VYGHINFKRGGNYRRMNQRVWYIFYVGRSYIPEVEIWWTFSIQNAKINEKRRPVAEILHSIEKRGRWIERRCTNLQRKFIHNRFYSCAVQMLLKMAVNATKCSTFEDQYCKSTSTRTTAIRHFRPTLTDRMISRMRTNSNTALYYC